MRWAMNKRQLQLTYGVRSLLMKARSEGQASSTPVPVFDLEWFSRRHPMTYCLHCRLTVTGVLATNATIRVVVICQTKHKQYSTTIPSSERTVE
jgi:hypothetical protein